MNLQKNNIKRYILRRYSIDELESIFNQKLNNQSRNFKHYANMSSNKFMVIVVSSITEEILVQLTDGWVEDSPIPEEGLYKFIQEIFGERIIKKYDELTNMNLHENIHRIKQMMGVINEGLHDTSWQNNEGDKITLMDLLNATEDIPVRNISVEELKPHLLSWDGDEDEVRKIESADLQYPILIFVNDEGGFITVIDGHHRAQKAARRGLETIKAKVIPINSLPKDIRRVFKHMN
jgi:hypothetical protein